MDPFGLEYIIFACKTMLKISLCRDWQAVETFSFDSAGVMNRKAV
jgi:hypothetical protein